MHFWPLLWQFLHPNCKLACVGASERRIALDSTGWYATLMAMSTTASGTPTAEMIADAFGLRGPVSLETMEVRGHRPLWRLTHAGPPLAIRNYGTTCNPLAAEPDPQLARISAFEHRVRTFGVSVPEIIASKNDATQFYGTAFATTYFQTEPWYPVCRYIFTAHKYVAGLQFPEDATGVDPLTFLNDVGKAFARIQLAGRGIGPWTTYPHNGPVYWKQVVEYMTQHRRDATWIQHLARNADMIGHAELLLPLTEKHERMLFSSDHGANNIEIAADNTIYVLDWEDFSPEHGAPIESIAGSWALLFERAEKLLYKHGKPAFLSAFASELQAAPEMLQPDARSRGALTSSLSDLRRDIRSVMFDDPYRAPASNELLREIDQASRDAEAVLTNAQLQSMSVGYSALML